MTSRTSRRWAILAGLSVLLVTAVAGAGHRPAAPRGFDRAVAAHAAHAQRLLDTPEVVGTAVGVAADGSAVVKVYTRSSRASGLPVEVDGVPVNVEETGDIVAQADPTASFDRPVPIGVSTGSERLIVYRRQLYCTGGTIGARVTDGTRVYALSNAHVYALQGSQTQGTVRVGATTGDRALQPGRVDMPGCGTSSEIADAAIGRLTKYVAISFSRTAHNTVDAAIALSSTVQLGNATPDGGYGTPSSQILSSPQLGQLVQKYGRTTGLTTGTVTGVNAVILVGYDKGVARFEHQIVVSGDTSSFSAAGDSGSLIVTDDNHPVALLFAGSSTTTIGNPIDLVLQKLGVTIDGAP